MAQKRIYEYLNNSTPQGARRDALYDAALEAADNGWTFMEAIFQLGEKAKEDGLDEDMVEQVLRKAFSDKENMVSADSTTAGREKAPVAAASVQAAAPVEVRRQKKATRGIDPEDVHIPWPDDDWRSDLSKLLEAAFEDDETFLLETDSEKTAKVELVKRILTLGDDTLATMKTLDKASALSMSINPSSGEGEERVSSWRHALVESSSHTLTKQLAYYKALNLPCSVIVNTGGGSMQAWVRIEARNRLEFEERIDFLYELLKRQGFDPDPRGRSTTARAAVPGVLRGGKQQYVIATDQGADSWSEWREWASFFLDGDPLVEPASNYDVPPSPAPELVESLLCQGHVLLLKAAPGSGLSHLLADFSLSLCHGLDWMGLPTEACGVLYASTQSDKNSFLNRLHEVAEKREVQAGDPDLGLLQLRGFARDRESLADFFIKRIRGSRRYSGSNYQVLVIESVDFLCELPAGEKDDVGLPLSQFLSRIAEEAQVAVIAGVADPNVGSSRKSPLDCDVRLELIQGEDGTFQLQGGSRFFPPMPPRRLMWEAPLFKALGVD